MEVPEPSPAANNEGERKQEDCSPGSGYCQWVYHRVACEPLYVYKHLKFKFESDKKFGGQLLCDYFFISVSIKIFLKFERQTEIFCVLVYYPDACSSWGWIRLKPGA